MSTSERAPARAVEERSTSTSPSWTYVARRTTREFSRDECTDLAAAVTYYAVLAVFPALIAARRLRAWRR